MSIGSVRAKQVRLARGNRSLTVAAPKGVGISSWTVIQVKGSGLFDLSKDIGEQNDLSEAQPQMLKKMKSRWAAWRKEMNDAEVRGPFRNY